MVVVPTFLPLVEKLERQKCPGQHKALQQVLRMSGNILSVQSKNKSLPAGPAPHGLLQRVHASAADRKHTQTRLDAGCHARLEADVQSFRGGHSFVKTHARVRSSRGKGSVLCLLGRELTKRRKRTSEKWAKALSMSKSKAGSGSARKAAGLPLPLPLPLAAPALQTGAAARAPACGRGATSSSNGNKSSGGGAGRTRRRRPLGGSGKAVVVEAETCFRA